MSDKAVSLLSHLQVCFTAAEADAACARVASLNLVAHVRDKVRHVRGWEWLRSPVLGACGCLQRHSTRLVTHDLLEGGLLGIRGAGSDV